MKAKFDFKKLEETKQAMVNAMIADDAKAIRAIGKEWNSYTDKIVRQYGSEVNMLLPKLSDIIEYAEYVAAENKKG